MWVGFIALLGIATDDGVVMSTYLNQRFAASPVRTVEEIRERTLGCRNASRASLHDDEVTTLLALLPGVTSTGRGSDVMVVPVLHSLGEKWRLRRHPAVDLAG